MAVDEIVHETKYLKFVLLKKGARTNRYGVFSVNHGAKLGEIKWHGAWFTYAFFPEIDTLFNDECLVNIITFIRKEMAKRT
jgi:hypothetical protein